MREPNIEKIDRWKPPSNSKSMGWHKNKHAIASRFVYTNKVGRRGREQLQ
jgi:hypothetical protein